MSQTTQPVVSWAGLCNYWLIKKVNQVRWIVCFSQPVDVSQTLWQLYWSPLFLGDKLSLKRWWIDINRMQFEPLHFSLLCLRWVMASWEILECIISKSLDSSSGMQNILWFTTLIRLCCFRQDQVLKVNILKILKAFFFFDERKILKACPQSFGFLGFKSTSFSPW